MHERIIEIINEAISVIGKNDPERLQELLITTKARLLNNKLSLAVMGQFKRGKSTFINALLGKNILPTGVVPLTSIVTEIEYGDESSITVYFKDGRERSEDINILANYVTEKNNPQNIKRVKKVQVRCPSRFLKERGFKIIDTPGIGSTYLHNTRETNDSLPSADVAIFLLSVDPPISQVEKEFLNNVKDQISKFIFVLNKIDVFSETEQKEVFDFTKKTLKGLLQINALTFLPVSALQALEAEQKGDNNKLLQSGIKKVTDEIDKLTNSKEEILLAAAVKRCENVLSHLKNLREIMIASLEQPIEELKEKNTNFLEKLDKIKVRQREIEFLLNGEITKLQQLIVEDLQEAKEEFIEKLTKETKKLVANKNTEDIKKIQTEINKFIEKRIIEEFNVWREKEEIIIKNKFSHAVSRFQDEINEIRSEIIKSAGEIFGVELNIVETKEKFSQESDFYFSFYKEINYYQINIMTLASVLPKFITITLVKNKATEKVQRDVDRTCGRLRWDYIQRIDGSIKKVKLALEQNMNNTIEDIKGIIDKVLVLKEAKENDNIETIIDYKKDNLKINQLLGELLSLKEKEIITN